LKDDFIEKAQDLINSGQLAAALIEVVSKVKKEELSIEDLDFLIETLIQISKPSEKLNQASLQVLEILVRMFT
jgi:hypothetical protein